MSEEKAIFAAGCFWGIEKNFAVLRGVTSTRVGYTGGDTKNPTYDAVCDKATGHAEAVEVSFDPDQISYQNLLKEFFGMHSASGAAGDWKNQYRSAIFYHSESQKEQAEQYKASMERKLNATLSTQIVPAQTFWEAEDYHQQYYMK